MQLDRLFASGQGFKKSDLAPLTVKYLRKEWDMKKPKPAHLQARDQLPQVIQFAAIDPGRKAKPSEDTHAKTA